MPATGSDGSDIRGQEVVMEHMWHDEVPMKDCSSCRLLAYEPTWYAALVAFDLTTASRDGEALVAA
jgi:hypothetical protein